MASGTTIPGTEFNDTLTDATVVGAGNDTFLGLGANDLLISTGGADSLDGGTGFDTADFSQRGSGVSVNVNLSTAIGTEGNSGSSLTSIEAVIGTGLNDVIIGDTVATGPLILAPVANFFNGGAGDDSINGGRGNDTIVGGAGDDVLDGGEGTFDIVSFASLSVANGGTVSGVSVRLSIGGGPGSATGQGSDVLAGFEGAIGTKFSDSLVGDGNANFFNAGAGGADTMRGAGGYDTVSFADRSGSVNVDLVAGTEGNSGSQILGFEAVIGSSFSDSILGDDAANVLNGGNGDDSVNGGAGNDTIQGGAGDDVLDGGAGTGDVVSFASLSVANGGTVSGVSVTLSIGGGPGTATGQGSDVLVGFEGVIGTQFSDSIVGDSQANFISAGAGGADTIRGAGGFDTVSFADRTTSVNVDLVAGTEGNSGSRVAGIEGVIGTSLGDSIAGDSVANFLSGGAGDDSINGGAGDDTIAGGTGDDVLDGGDGASDIVSFASLATANGGTVSGVTVRLSVGGGPGTATGQGSDVLAGFEGVIGSQFSDSIVGTSGANFLNVGAGGADTVIGGGGFDTVSFADRSTAVNLTLDVNGSGTDANSGTSVTGFSAVIGSRLADILTGNGNANFLSGGAGNDTISAGAGDDTVNGGAGDDSLDGGPGLNDIISFASLATANVGAVTGVTVDLSTQSATGQGADIVVGFEGIIGSRFNDSLTGDDAANYITGGAGADTLTGLRGADAFYFTAGQANGDLVTDFSGAPPSGVQGDRLYFTGYNAGTATFTALGGDQYQISDGVITDVITVIGTVSAGDWAFV